MSIDNEILRIKNAKTAIRNAVIAKGGTLTEDQLIDDYAAAVTALPTETDVDLDFVTATANDILAGKVGADVNGLPVNGNIQTVTAELTDNVVTVPKGYIETAQTLTVPAVTASLSDNTVTVPKGYISEAQILTVAEAKAPTVSGNAVTVYKGYQAEQTTVEVAKATATLSANTVTIPAGYHDANTLTVPVAGAVTVSGNVVTIPAGYNANQQTKTVGTAKGAATYTPSTADQTIAAGTYLSGVQTIKGDANLIADNIKKDVTIFGVAGTHEGGSSMDFYKCAAVYGPRKVTRIKVENAGTTDVNGDYEKTTFTTESGGEVWKHLSAEYYVYDYHGTWGLNGDYNTYPDGSLYYCWDGVTGSWSTGSGSGNAPTVSKISVTLDEDVQKTWDGYKAVLIDGVYDFEKTLTTGLTYGISYVPVVGGIYSADALVQVSGLFDNIVNNFPGSASLFAIDANIGINDLVGGGAPTLIGSGEVLQNGEFCFDNTRAFDYVIGDSMSALGDFTIEMDYTITSDTTGYCGFFGNKSSWSTMTVCMQWGRSGYRPAMFWNDYFDTRTGGDEHPEWVNDGIYHHVAYVRKGEVIRLYSDGEMIAEYTGATKKLNLAIENLLAVGVQHVEEQILPGRIKHFRVLNEAIYDGDFVGNLPVWVGA